MYSGEYDACDVTLSVYPHRASLKNRFVGSIPTVLRHIFQACPVWIYTQSNITSKQVGNLSAHALQFARFKGKRLGASKSSNLIFERFIGVFGSFFLLTKKLLIYCIVGKTRKV
jgi:hypothetical protein